MHGQSDPQLQLLNGEVVQLAETKARMVARVLSWGD